MPKPYTALTPKSASYDDGQTFGKCRHAVSRVVGVSGRCGGGLPPCRSDGPEEEVRASDSLLQRAAMVAGRANRRSCWLGLQPLDAPLGRGDLTLNHLCISAGLCIRAGILGSLVGAPFPFFGFKGSLIKATKTQKRGTLIRICLLGYQGLYMFNEPGNMWQRLGFGLTCTSVLLLSFSKQEKASPTTHFWSMWLQPHFFLVLVSWVVVAGVCFVMISDKNGYAVLAAYVDGIQFLFTRAISQNILQGFHMDASFWEFGACKAACVLAVLHLQQCALADDNFVGFKSILLSQQLIF